MAAFKRLQLSCPIELTKSDKIRMGRMTLMRVYYGGAESVEGEM